MKKVLVVLLCFIFSLLSGCSNEQGANGNKTLSNAQTIQIQDTSFIAQANDIYKNPDNYKDKLIIVQGLYKTVTTDNVVRHYITRTAQGSDGKAIAVGFEFKYNGTMPTVDDWIKISGNIESVKGANNTNSVILNTSKLEVMPEKGSEIVTN